MRGPSRYLWFVIVCLSTAIYPLSQISAQPEVKTSATPPTCKRWQDGKKSPSEVNSFMQERTVVGIAWYWAEVGEYDKALELGNKIQDCGFRDLTVSGVVNSLAQKGQFDRALQLVASAVKVRKISPYVK